MSYRMARARKLSRSNQSTSCLIRIEQGVDAYYFSPPEWVDIKWEDNQLGC